MRKGCSEPGHDVLGTCQLLLRRSEPLMACFHVAEDDNLPPLRAPGSAEVTGQAALCGGRGGATPTPRPQPAPAPVTPPPSSMYCPNCAAARAAGMAPVRVGQPGYGRHFDRDGVGCE
ncbi:excalibur calcium-binding domain-containing protein [Deinococcus sp. HSC-46F16]|uniref:excalibur calcium-binding domain-containing protein n=1 Tax=Deinococcus sp. HSC-46F16 TaxID=2910968 RepID=UPI003532748F